MTINGTGIRVTLRNLVFIQLGSGLDAVSFQAGAELNVRDCEIQGVQDYGINAQAVDGKLNVSNVVIRDAGVGGVRLATGIAALDRVQVTGSETGIYVTESGRMSVIDSVIADNLTGILVQIYDGHSARDHRPLRDHRQFERSRVEHDHQRHARHLDPFHHQP